MYAQVVYGPPGTGKSSRIVDEINSLINDQQVPENRIGILSFTRAAAKEISIRTSSDCIISTVHSLAYKLSDINKGQVINNQKLIEFGKIVGIEIIGIEANDLDDYSTSDHIGDEYMALYNLSKCMLQTFEEAYNSSLKPGTFDEFMYFCESMDKWKKTFGYIDFNDMLLRALHAEGPDLDVMFIDEAQDLSPLQWAVIEHWATKITWMCIAGDDDQSIYAWSGADPLGMQKFEERHKAHRTILSDSYRLPKVIKDYSQEIIEKVEGRVHKEYEAAHSGGVVNRYSVLEMIGDIKHGDDVLILYRNHFMRQDVEDYLVQMRVPYLVENGFGILQSDVVRAVKLWEDMVHSEDISMFELSLRDMKLIQRFVSEKYKLMLEKQEFQELRKLSWEETIHMRYEHYLYIKGMLEEYGTLDIKPSVKISTIHSSKGREADRVILINGMSERTYNGMVFNPDAEYRVFYVGATRAKERLDVVLADNAIDI